MDYIFFDHCLISLKAHNTANIEIPMGHKTNMKTNKDRSQNPSVELIHIGITILNQITSSITISEMNVPVINLSNIEYFLTVFTCTA